MNKQQEFHKRITDEILKAMYENGADWIKGWVGANLTMPMNATTKAHYHGYNILTLWMAQKRFDYPTAEWATFRQWANAGYRLKEGSTAKDRDQIVIKVGTSINEEDGKEHAFKWQKMFYVFNAAQVEGYETPEQVTFDTKRPYWFQEFMIRLGVKLHHGSPAYAPGKDLLFLPDAEQFMTEEHYIGTATHELMHWTGHKSRLDRDMRSMFGDRAYAIEELIAELGRCFTLAHWGMGIETRDHSAKYLNSWIEALEDDPRAVQRVASRAGAASEYLLEHGAAKEEVA